MECELIPREMALVCGEVYMEETDERFGVVTYPRRFATLFTADITLHPASVRARTSGTFSPNRRGRAAGWCSSLRTSPCIQRLSVRVPPGHSHRTGEGELLAGVHDAGAKVARVMTAMICVDVSSRTRGESAWMLWCTMARR
jgi:hypothetical protein